MRNVRHVSKHFVFSVKMVKSRMTVKQWPPYIKQWGYTDKDCKKTSVFAGEQSKRL